MNPNASDSTAYNKTQHNTVQDNEREHDEQTLTANFCSTQAINYSWLWGWRREASKQASELASKQSADRIQAKLIRRHSILQHDVF